MRADAGQAFLRGIATCAHVHEKDGTILLALGFADGEVIIVDSYGIEQCRWRAHATPVNSISSDINGYHFASCSDDGNVAVRQIYNEENNNIHNNNISSFLDDTLETQSFNQPLECLQIDPYYNNKNKNEKVFITGGPQGQLILSRKNWFNQKDVILHDGEGPITCINWYNSFLAWSNDRGIKIINIETNEKITFVERPPNEEPNSCKLIWESDVSLIIIWDRTIQLIQQCSMVLSPGEEPRTCAQIIKVWEVGIDHTICGLIPFDINTFAVLCIVNEYDEDNENENDEDDHSPMPELQLRNRFTGELLLTPDALPMKNFEQLMPNQFFLQATPITQTPTTNAREAILKAPTLFIVSSNEIIVGKIRDYDDQITIALSEHKYREALEIARSHPLLLRRHRLPDIIQQYLEDLLYHEEYTEAASICPILFKHDIHAWEFWILRFMKLNQLHVLAPYIPTESPTKLEVTTYQLVLDHFIATNSIAFLSTIKLWGAIDKSNHNNNHQNKNKNHSNSKSNHQNNELLFSLSITMKHIQDQLNQEGPDNLLIEAQALLYIKTRQYEDSLNCYLKLEYGNNIDDVEIIFNLIKDYNLYYSIRNKIVTLINLDQTLTGELLLDAKAIQIDIPIEIVIKQLSHSNELTLWYLHLLYIKNIILYNDNHYISLHLKQCQLYAEIGYLYDLKTLKHDDDEEDDSGGGGEIEGRQLELKKKSSKLNIQKDDDNDEEDRPMIGFLKWSWNAQNDSDFYYLVYDICKNQNEIILNEIKNNPIPIPIQHKNNNKINNKINDKNKNKSTKEEKEKMNNNSLLMSENKRFLYNEMVFILNETQQTQEALLLLLTKINNVKRAIEFVENEKDINIIKELWDTLISYSLENKEFLTGMLDYAGLYSIELPSRILKEIPSNMEIHNLSQKLYIIIEDYRYQLSLQLSCRNAIETWFYKERTKLYQMQRRGCRGTIVESSQLSTSSSHTSSPSSSSSSSTTTNANEDIVSHVNSSQPIISKSASSSSRPIGKKRVSSKISLENLRSR